MASYQDWFFVRGYIESVRSDVDRRLNSLIGYIDQILSQQRGDAISGIEFPPENPSAQNDLEILKESERRWDEIQETRKKLLSRKRKGSG